MKKVGAFVKELSSHSIYDHKILAKEFEQETGKKADWPIHTVGRTNSTLGTFKGLEQEIEGNESELVAYGYEIAAWAEQRFAKNNEWSHYHGRGSSFDASVRELEKANV